VVVSNRYFHRRFCVITVPRCNRLFLLEKKALDLGPCGCRSQQCQPLYFWLGGLSSITQYSVTFWHDGPLHVYYCHVRILSKNSLWYHGLSFVIMFRSWCTTVIFVCILFFFQFTTLLFLFDTVILSQQGSLLFTTRVFQIQNDTKKTFMSRLSNPIPTDIFITGIRLLFFYNFFHDYFWCQCCLLLSLRLLLNKHF